MSSCGVFFQVQDRTLDPIPCNEKCAWVYGGSFSNPVNQAFDFAWACSDAVWGDNLYWWILAPNQSVVAHGGGTCGGGPKRLLLPPGEGQVMLQNCCSEPFTVSYGLWYPECTSPQTCVNGSCQTPQPPACTCNCPTGYSCSGQPLCTCTPTPTPPPPTATSSNTPLLIGAGVATAALAGAGIWLGNRHPKVAAPPVGAPVAAPAHFGARRRRW